MLVRRTIRISLKNPNAVLKSLEGRTDKSNVHIKIATEEITPVYIL